MARYLIRAGFDPLSTVRPDPDDYVWRSYVGGNSGNLMFAYGVMNALQTETAELSYTYKWAFDDAELDAISERFDAFVLPMADAFRIGFMRQLEGLTKAVRRLRIPVIVVGVAVRADYEPDFTAARPFDDLARDFVAAVLDNGGAIGLRGRLTADYLARLGFREEEHFSQIGCPSLYAYGLGPGTRPLPDVIEKLVMNTNGYYDVGHINDFLLNTFNAFPDCALVQQMQHEFRDLYIGRHWLPALVSPKGKREDKLLIQGRLLREAYRRDGVRYFFDVPSWVNFMRPFDLFVGNRFHGCCAAVLAGVPHVMIPFNARTRELTEYHHLTCLKPEDIREGTRVQDYLDQLDFKAFDRHQSENLDRYIDFLNRNGLEHIFAEKRRYAQGESPLERRMQAALGAPLDAQGNIVHDFESLSAAQKAARTLSCNLKFYRPENFKSMLGKMNNA